MASGRPIKGFEELYIISEEGHVFSVKRRKYLKQFTNVSGYQTVYLYPQDGKSKRKNPCIHKLIAEAYISNPLNRRVVNHRDGNKQNNSLKNLEWVTKSEDGKHANRMGLRKVYRGTELYNAKLCDEDVMLIREMGESMNQRQLAAMFGVSQATLWSVLHNHTWKHVQ